MNIRFIHFVFLAWNFGMLAAFGVVSIQSIGLLAATWALFLLGCLVANGGALLIIILLYVFLNPYILCTMEFGK